MIKRVLLLFYSILRVLPPHRLVSFYRMIWQKGIYMLRLCILHLI